MNAFNGVPPFRRTVLCATEPLGMDATAGLGCVRQSSSSTDGLAVVASGLSTKRFAAR